MKSAHLWFSVFIKTEFFAEVTHFVSVLSSSTLQRPKPPPSKAKITPSLQEKAFETFPENVNVAIIWPKGETLRALECPFSVSFKNTKSVPSFSSFGEISLCSGVVTFHFKIPFRAMHDKFLIPRAKIRPSRPENGFSRILKGSVFFQRSFPLGFTNERIFLSLT